VACVECAGARPVTGGSDLKPVIAGGHVGYAEDSGEVAELFSTVIEPPALVISAEIFRASDAGSGDGSGPVGVQFVLTQLTLIVPPGVTVQDCEAVPPEEVVAVTAKLLGARDCAAVGDQVIMFPLRAAPVGELVRAKVTPPPAGSTAAS